MQPPGAPPVAIGAAGTPGEPVGASKVPRHAAMNAGAESSGVGPRSRPTLNPMGDGRIGAVAPMSDKPARGAGRAGGAGAPRERITVDLRGLKPALLALAHARGVALSAIVHEALAGALASGGTSGTARPGSATPRGVDAGGRVRIGLRLSRPQARRLAAAAREAGLPLGTYVAGLSDGIHAVGGGRYADQLAAATATCAELATLSRNLRHLGELLRGSAVRAALEYRAMLDALDADVRRHLGVASAALEALHPRRPLAPGAAVGRRRTGSAP